MAVPYNSNYDLTIPFSDVSVPIHLTSAGGVVSYTVPGVATNNYAVRFGYTDASNIFVRLNAAPTVPAANSATAVQYEEFKPGYDGSQRYVKGGDTIQFITPDTVAYMSISLRSLD